MADMYRFFRLEVDIDEDQYAGLSARRLLTYLERLPAYEGAVGARIFQLQEEQKQRNPSRDVLGRAGTTVSDLVSGPDLADLVEYERV